MNATNDLRRIVAAIMQIGTDSVHADLDLRSRLQNSISRGKLDAAIRRQLNITCTEVYTATTYGELEAAAFGKPCEATTKSIQSLAVDVGPSALRNADDALIVPSVPTGVQCGIDLECPEDLPLENDYWESDFYRSHFTPKEIAYCITQADPRQHFAARWCVKEALKKCDSKYLKIEMNRLEVSHDEIGRPSIGLISEETSVPLPVSISLAHTKSTAVAIVIRVGLPANEEPAEFSPTNTTSLVENSLSKHQVCNTPKRGSFFRLFGA